MKSFYDKENYTIDDIDSLIKSEAEESIYLEFKEAGALDKTDNKRKEISKDVSAFANSDGGIIIYGIREENHKAIAFSFINGNSYTKEWLEQVINSTIQRHIPELKIYPLRRNGLIDETIYIVKIPKSLEAPHISKDKRFYKRFNFESVSMEEYEIRQLYGRKSISKLIIAGYAINKLKHDNDSRTNAKFHFEATIINDGDITEKDYKLNVYFNNFHSALNISWDMSKTNYDYTWMEDKRLKISAVGKTPIFPNEKVNAIRFNFEIPLQNLQEVLRQVTIEAVLLYPNGESKLNGDMKELAEKINVPDNGEQD